MKIQNQNNLIANSLQALKCQYVMRNESEPLKSCFNLGFGLENKIKVSLYSCH